MLRRVLAVSLVLTGCSSSTGNLDIATLAGPDVDNLRVTDTTTVESAGAARLSPDGTRTLFVIDRPCVRKLDGSGEECVDRDKVIPDLLNAAWSPDGTKLVFTNDFWRMMHEPDVWVLDVAAGDLRNLTDDGEDEDILSGDNANAQLDLLPSWSPDGETIWFARGRAEADSVELMTVPADGGETSTLGEIQCGPRELTGMAWSRSQVAWTCGMNEGEVFLADHSGDDAERVLSGEDGRGGEDRMLLSFSPDGTWLLADSLGPYGSYDEFEGGLAKAVPTGGGDPVPVADRAGFPTWSPDGHALAYVELPNRLMAVAEPGGQPRELRESETNFVALDGRRIGWAEDKLLVGIDNKPTLLTVTD